MKSSSDMRWLLFIHISVLIVDLSASQLTAATDLGGSSAMPPSSALPMPPSSAPPMPASSAPPMPPSSAPPMPLSLPTETQQPALPTPSPYAIPTTVGPSTIPTISPYAQATTTYIPVQVSVSPAFQNVPAVATTYLPPPPSSMAYVTMSPAPVTRSPTPPFIPPSATTIPVFPQPTPPPRASSTAASVSSTTSLPVGTQLHFQWTFWNVYSQAITQTNMNLTSAYSYVQPQIANLFDVTSDRITDIVFQVDSDGYVVVRFNIKPGSSILTSNIVALKSFLSILIYQGQGYRIQLDLPGDTNLYPLKAYYNWTDGGLCPTQACQQNVVCLCSLSGTLYCETGAPSSSEMSPHNNLALLGLIAIPLFIVIVVAIFIAIYLLKFRVQKEKSRIAFSDLGYNDGVSRISGMTMADVGVRNLVYTTMGKTFATHFNKDTFSMSTSHCNQMQTDDSDEFKFNDEKMNDA